MKLVFVYVSRVFFRKKYASRAFLRRPLKKRYSVKRRSVLGSDISPSQVSHVTATAFGAAPDVDVPDRLQQFGQGKAGIPFPETLASLECKDQLQVLGLVSVVQEPIVTDFLETGRQHVHQVTPDELGVCKRDEAAWLARPPPSGREGHPPFVN